MARTAGIKEPIRDTQKIRQMKEWLLVNKTFRDYFLLFMGLNCGLRIGDLLQLRVMDVRNKAELRIIMQKNEKELVIPLNPEVQQEIKKYTKDKSETEFLFVSREGDNKPITTKQAERVLKEAAKACGIENWGTHSMRKSFGYHFYQLNQDVHYLMKLFGHRSQTQTLGYIGITSDEIRESMKHFVL
jgi:integrase